MTLKLHTIYNSVLKARKFLQTLEGSETLIMFLDNNYCIPPTLVKFYVP